jgi:aminoglycoside 6'-N-acetyltransferase
MLTFRPLTAADFELLTVWRNAPHVAAWWDGPQDLERITAQYAPRLTGDDPVRMYIAEWEGRPLGRIQYEPTHGWLPEFGHDVANIDFLIGNEADIGRGLGPRMIAGFLREVVLKDRRFTRVVSDPAKANRRSVRALEKAGFHAVGERQAEGQTCLIMEWSGPR